MDLHGNQIYDETMRKFEQDFYKSNLAMSDYLPYLQTKGIQDFTSQIPEANLDELRAMLTYCIRAERFCDGYWLGLLKDKTFLKILWRLKTLECECEQYLAG